MWVNVEVMAGRVLDWAVGQIEGTNAEGKPPLPYSTDWATGGYLLDKYKLDVVTHTYGFCVVDDWGHGEIYKLSPEGETYLIAAGRHLVCANLGDRLKVPEWVTSLE
ncbi:hypothetical protein [Pseudomonas sp.]|uniref:hypothetical protein n=1 Tax=Pseudomonas sp. TaxID=306 RepID=UPI00273224F7|nr:hypothetical protein [Pseudomonas sp.]MDP2446574.1 hypothetical protein [Pseudomonas sp.]MDZ4334260.1 hypothetical protein [Pseudomonas sp.]